MILLVHPDKNAGSERSELATKALREIWESRHTLSARGWGVFCQRHWVWTPEKQFLEAEARVKELQAAGGSTSNSGGQAGSAEASSSGGGVGSNHGEGRVKLAHPRPPVVGATPTMQTRRGRQAPMRRALRTTAEEDFEQGGEGFEHGEEGGSPPRQTDPEALTVRWEPVNVQALDEALNLDAVRRFHAFGLYDVLHSIRLRARHIKKGKVGWVCVAEEEGKAARGCWPAATPAFTSRRTAPRPGPSALPGPAGRAPGRGLLRLRGQARPGQAPLHRPGLRRLGVQLVLGCAGLHPRGRRPDGRRAHEDPAVLPDGLHGGAAGVVQGPLRRLGSLLQVRGHGAQVPGHPHRGRGGSSWSLASTTECASSRRPRRTSWTQPGAPVWRWRARNFPIRGSSRARSFRSTTGTWSRGCPTAPSASCARWFPATPSRVKGRCGPTRPTWCATVNVPKLPRSSVWGS